MRKKHVATDPLLDKTPPQAIEVEANLLSSIFAGKGAIGVAREWLNPEDFYKGSHKKIFAGMIEVASKQGDVDVTVLGDYLQQKGELESIGGLAYLVHLMDEVPMSLNVEEHAKIILRCSVKRFSIVKASGLIESALKDGIDLNEYLEQWRQVNSEVREKATRGPEANDFSKLSLGDLFQGSLIETPLESLNEKIMGYAPGELTIVGGNPGMGKTAFCLGQLMKTVNEGKGVIYCAAQMDERRIFTRILAQMCGLNFRKLLGGRFPKDKRGELMAAHKKIVEFSQRGLIKYHIIKDRIEFSDLVMKVENTVRKSDVEFPLLIIENLQQIDHIGMKFDSRFKRANHTINQLKPWIQVELGISTLVSSQLNRDVEDREDPQPKANDICSSEAQDLCDNIILLHRPNVFNLESSSGEVETIEENARIVAAKGVKPAIIQVRFHGESLTWLDK